MNAPANASPQTSRKPERTASIDLLRGIVMVIMALDHTRDFFDATPFDPTDLDKTYPALFFTRWITHFCAPTFVFLAGTAAWLSRSKRSDGELAVFLVKRGVWLVFFEIAVNNLCWSFDLTYSHPFLQVIWAIGCSMIFLALLVRFSPRVIATIGFAIVVLHNLLDRVHVEKESPWHALWAIFHERDFNLHLGSHHYGLMYPLVPWIGVMALGYALGSLFVGDDRVPRPRASRSRQLIQIGLIVILGFVLIRGLDVYGDPEPWEPRGTFVGTLMAFLDCEKYPPSLCYLAMTLGPGLVLLGLFDRFLEGAPKGLAAIFVVYGRVPFFYYMLHVVLINAASEVVYSRQTGVVTIARHWAGDQPLTIGLPLTYLTWALVVASLYPVCLWFSRVKASPWGRQQAWLSYL